jgi:hypothetical protein
VSESDLPSLDGSYRVGDGEVRFAPTFPFLRGQSYVARWTDPEARSGRSVELAFAVPPFTARERTRVAAIFPSSDRLPVNVLRLYVHFTAPMSEGEASRHLHLFRDDGNEVAEPFAVPQRELWNRERDRLTLLFDPGRVKREVGPNLDVGPPLEVGRSYRLVVDSAWRDSSGRPLAEDFDKRFLVTEADDSQPAVERWRIAPPESAGAPLVVSFPAPLDHALLARLLSVVDVDGREIAGRIEVDDGERRWRFTPDDPWRRAGYSLVVDRRLEDPSGNSLRGLFELPQGHRAGEAEAASGDPATLAFFVDVP